MGNKGSSLSSVIQSKVQSSSTPVESYNTASQLANKREAFLEPVNLPAPHKAKTTSAEIHQNMECLSQHQIQPSPSEQIYSYRRIKGLKDPNRSVKIPEAGGEIKIWGSKFYIQEYKKNEKPEVEIGESQDVKEEDDDDAFHDCDADYNENDVGGKSAFLELPDLVLHHTLSFLDVHSLLNLRTVCSATKRLVESVPHILRLTVTISSFQKLKLVSSSPVTGPWRNFHLCDRIREMAGPTTISNTPEWDHVFSRWISNCGPHIQNFSSEMLLTFSETDRLLSLKNLQSFKAPGFVYSIEHIMNTKRTLGKYDNVILGKEGLVLQNLSRLTLEGCTTLGSVLTRTPNLSYLCVTSGIGANSTLQSSGWRDADYTKSVWTALCTYVKDRYHPLQAKKIRTNLVIDFGKCKTDRLTFREEDGLFEMFCALCYPVHVIELVNVRTKWLPHLIDSSSSTTTQTTIPVKIFSASYNCVKSVYVETNTAGRFIPRSVSNFVGAITLFPYFPKTFQLPEKLITELTIMDVREGVREFEVEQVLRPRKDLRRLSLQYNCSSLFDKLLDFSLFPNLKHFSMLRFPNDGKKFWELCKYCKKLESLELREIPEKVLLTKSAGENLPAITKLQELRNLVLKKCYLTKKTTATLKHMHLERVVLSKIKLQSVQELLDGPLTLSLKKIEICLLGEDDTETIRNDFFHNCKSLGKCEVSSS